MPKFKCKHCAGGCVSRLTASTTGNIGCHELFQDAMPLTLTSKPIMEDVSGIGRILKLGGQFQFADKPNANGRIYPGEILTCAVGEIQEDIGARRVMGEFDHPPDARSFLPIC